MINAKELRIGNWVNYKKIGVKQVTTIWHDVNMDAEPIPLTPAILEKCGFEQDVSENIEHYKVFEKRIGCNQYDQTFYMQTTSSNSPIDHCGIFSKESPVNNCEVIRSPQYLHQLQNLYYSLTGEELEIELPLAPIA